MKEGREKIGVGAARKRETSDEALNFRKSSGDVRIRWRWAVERVQS